MQPWSSKHSSGPISRPLRHNGTPYTGINVVSLCCTAVERGYVALIDIGSIGTVPSLTSERDAHWHASWHARRVSADPYRQQAKLQTPPPDPYLQAWRTLRRLRLTAALTIVSWLPVGFIGGLILPRNFVPVVVLPMTLLVLATTTRLRWFSCPRCNQLFSVKNGLWRRTNWQWNCVHCGLEVDARKH